MRSTPETEKVVDGLCLMDDTLFRVAAQDKGFCEEILRVLLQKEDLKVITVQVQKDLHHIHSHSVVLDVLCKDSHNKRYNIEVQKEDNDDHQRRVRYHAASVDTTMLEKGKSMQNCRICVWCIYPALIFFRKEKRFIMLTGHCGKQKMWLTTDFMKYMLIHR